MKTLPSITNPSLFELPSVTDKDICWVTSLLGLPSEAFQGEGGSDPRQHVLRSMEPIDIAACPGSGKTTLLVAKLAILARGWRHSTQGICVLSHTNAARHEIETRLGTTNVGRQLLSYPHFIGTIHGFVNEFLALPWLRSLGYPISLIDSQICEIIRWNKLDGKWRYALQNKHVELSNVRIVDACFNLSKKNGPFPFKENTQTYRELQSACQEVAEEGYHCYDDMFIWANDLMDRTPNVIQSIRDRFPLLFIDEAQDNSEDQSATLHRLFTDGDGAVVRQRLGDANQAIYGFVGATEASTERFPNESIKTDLPNSHRFGQDIADLVDPLGLAPYGLKGHGPKQTCSLSSQPKGKHTVFLFHSVDTQKVLDAYADLLLETFSTQELREGVFTAVGQVHKPPDDGGDEHPPRHVGHYWPDYDPELSRSEPKPQTFAQYVSAGLAKLHTTGETYHFVEKVAEGVLRLASMAKGATDRPRGQHNHRNVLRLLGAQPDFQKSYTGLIKHFVEHRDSLTEAAWDNGLETSVHVIANAIAWTSSDDPEVRAFLKWSDERINPVALPAAQKGRDNIYRFSRNGEKVAIRVGSIHSVKGENHTATLVLETFWYDHNLDSLKKWLCGDKKGFNGKQVRISNRLRVHYVAMTRPSHLICLAMKRASFEDEAGNLAHPTSAYVLRCMA